MYPKLAVAMTLVSILSGCSLTRMLPKGPVLDPAEREAVWGTSQSSGVDYLSEPTIDQPVLPFMIFGLTYDLDIALVSKHPDWDMHEYARIQTPDGPLWIAKDSRKSTGDQLLVADIDDIYHWLPEIPLARKSDDLEVVERGEGDQLDLTFRYENFDGQPVEAHYEGPRPESDQSKRNGSTMGHSRNQVLAVLDLPYRDFGTDASISIDGQDWGMKRILGLKSMQFALRQTQGGIAEGQYRIEQGEAGGEQTEVDGYTFPARFRTLHAMPGGPEVPMTWQTMEGVDALLVRQESRLRQLTYRFKVTSDGALELTDARVRTWNATDDTLHIAFSPPLPDLRRRFKGSHQSRFVVDINGQRNHAVGKITTDWTDRGPRLQIRGETPWWFAERCASTTIDFENGVGARLHTDVRPCK